MSGSVQPFDSLRPAGDWRAARLAAGFVVDVANLSRPRNEGRGGDVLEPLVFAAIVQANQALLTGDPEVRARYGDTGETIPDALRRPISVRAVAESLRLSYETTRRRVQRMAEAGLCVVTPAGAYVPGAVIASQQHAQVQAARMDRLLRFADELAAAGVLGPDEALVAAPPPALVRTVNRALSQYMLRTCERVIELAGGALDGFVLLGLAAAQPCSALSLTARLGLPAETVRRRLGALKALGMARRTKRGWQVSARASQWPRIARHVAEHDADLRRLIARLRELAELPPPQF
jgi:DNA-binding IclR family transcriptional regulator